MASFSNIMLKPEQIIELFNKKLAGVGKIKKCPGFFLPAAIVQDFIIMSGYPRFDQIETWEEYFDMISKSTFLTTQFTPSIAWLFKAENAFKVFSGQYDNKDISPINKPAQNVNGQAQAMASDLFNKIIQAGNSNLMNTLSNLSDTDKRAIEIFGRASEILNCSDYQSTEIKIRLKNAFVHVLSNAHGLQ